MVTANSMGNIIIKIVSDIQKSKNRLKQCLYIFLNLCLRSHQLSDIQKRLFLDDQYTRRQDRHPTIEIGSLKIYLYE